MWDIPEENRLTLNDGETPAALVHFGWLERIFAECVFWINVPEFIDRPLSWLSPYWRGYVPCFSMMLFPVTGEYIITFHLWGHMWTVIDRKRRTR